jgi:hypothetical protein
MPNEQCQQPVAASEVRKALLQPDTQGRALTRERRLNASLMDEGLTAIVRLAGRCQAVAERPGRDIPGGVRKAFRSVTNVEPTAHPEFGDNRLAERRIGRERVSQFQELCVREDRSDTRVDPETPLQAHVGVPALDHGAT